METRNDSEFFDPAITAIGAKGGNSEAGQKRQRAFLSGKV